MFAAALIQQRRSSLHLGHNGITHLRNPISRSYSKRDFTYLRAVGRRTIAFPISACKHFGLPSSTGMAKRKASDAQEDALPKRSKALEEINNAIAVAESDPKKRKAWSITDDASGIRGKKQFQYENSPSTHSSVPRRSMVDEVDHAQLIRLRLNFSDLILRRTNIYITATSDYAVLHTPAMAGPELLIHIHNRSVNIVLLVLYECEAQMRTSGVYDLDSVLGFLRRIRGHFEWPATDIGVDNPGLVWAIQQLKRHMGYEWEDGPNGTTGR
jgi:hypothetical protein